MKKMSTKMAQSKAHSSGTAELLLEIGVEELPYQFIAPALSSLTEDAALVFESHRLSCGSINAYGTPRRLLLVVERLAIHQAAFTNEAMGPSKSVAFDQAGQPTKAAIGFARGQGVPVESLRVRQTPRGEYLFAVKEDAGRPTKTVLIEILPQIVSELSFPKAMKWNEAGVRFARPVRWLVALYGGAVLPIEIAGIKAGNKTYGHRVMGNGKAITVSDHSSYCRLLKRQGVLPDQEERRVTIREQLEMICKGAGLGLNADEDLLEQAVFTTEWPCAILGSFKLEYLAVPSEVLITSMKEHQGFFSLCDKKSGSLAAHFIAVANNELKNMSLIREGNERVLAARLADAKFFFDEDRKVKLEERVTKLAGVTFHQKLGTMEKKQQRVRKLAGFIASNLQPHDGELKQACERAADLCKADLLTGVVGEFPELQGIMGGYYAQHDGESESVSKAIRDQYFPRGMEGRLPETLQGKVLALADRLDTVVAFFQSGIIPKGSEDPFALRRHALSIVRIIVEGKLKLDLHEVVAQAEDIVKGSVRDGASMLSDPFSFIVERFRFYAGTTQDLRDDVVAALTNFTGYEDKQCDLVAAFDKMKPLQEVISKPEFDPLIVGFKRAHRIVEKEDWKEKSVDPALFKDPVEAELHRQIGICRNDFDQHMAMGDYQNALDALIRLKPAIDAFFDAVMVNADVPAIRSNRLSLLKEVDDFFMLFADFSQIVVQGG